MPFETSASKYDAFMGRYSALLSPQLADLAEVAPGQRVLDVGCGPGALTGELVRRLGPALVAAIDPTEAFVAATRERYSGVDARVAWAESLPFPEATFDASLAQLVVQFMSDPVAGLRELARVTKPGGVVAASVWDFGGGSPMTAFWRAARDLDPAARDESHLAGAREGDLAELLRAARLREVTGHALTATVTHPTFESWWDPFELGVGPAGSYAAALDPQRRAMLRERCRQLLPRAPFDLTVRAWAARGLA